jgi:hypothetical protein
MKKSLPVFVCAFPNLFSVSRNYLSNRIFIPLIDFAKYWHPIND